ncbi:uncharacterized protein LOC109834334 isoform X2 [Asparagus officinalis]|uniref:uncharacterized protein LOC109834334 isoform X2 n=1 Tax=Asparagus officinalis TaxID=4686 RepID=UPI00098E7BC2|nr:uncharacterized protein LOC109834334 isoform X2 [Asparagus officinalis]
MSSHNNNNSDNNSNFNNPWRQQAPSSREEEIVAKAWGVLLFGIIGATITTLALNKSQSNQSWKRGASSSGWGTYREEAWRRRYKQRLQEEYEEEMERVERIRRMQSVFNRERNKYKRSYESWREYGPGAYQHYQRDDWYWHTDTSYRDQRTNYWSTPTNTGNYSMSHHYSVLGLDRSRAKPYTEAEIKTAFRVIAMKYHPDQNKDNIEVAEAKFKEVMASYEAIKLERKNANCC